VRAGLWYGEAGDGASAALGEPRMTQRRMPSRMMHLNLFVFGCGHHRGAWRHPHSSVERLGDIRYYEQLAQTAERGKLDAVFFADGHAVGNVNQHRIKHLCDPVSDGPAAGVARPYLRRAHGLECGDLHV